MFCNIGEVSEATNCLGGLKCWYDTRQCCYWKEERSTGSGAEVEEVEAGNAPERGFALLDYVTGKEQYKNLLMLFGCHDVAALIAVNLEDS